MTAEGCYLGSESQDLVCVDARIQILNDSATSLAISYLADRQDVGLAVLADLVAAVWNHSDAGALIWFARAISTAHLEFFCDG
jgi:hypothetical protein